ncbi:hypothetical protein BBP40_007699 [Aspergillus hancockii]|nr:hypothetical protein BBP40_007699 [Aspergillus hancockii]
MSTQHRQRIIGAGLPRTGTTSLAAALDQLKFGPVLHAHKEHETRPYTRLLEAKTQRPDANAADLESLTGIALGNLTAPYNATLDSPTADFYVELCEVYPDSLVILTIRDTDDQWWGSWYNSLGITFGDDWPGRLRRLLLWASRTYAARIPMIMNYTMLWRAKYGDYGPIIHKLHNAEVIKNVPPHRLLVFNVKQGWEPLCSFLGVEVPSQPFPIKNERKEFVGLVQQELRVCTLKWLVALALLGWSAWLLV